MDPKNIEPSKQGEGVYIPPDLEKRVKNLPPDARRDFLRVMKKQERKESHKHVDDRDDDDEYEVEEDKDTNKKDSIFDIAHKGEKVVHQTKDSLPMNEETLVQEKGEEVDATPEFVVQEPEEKWKESHVFVQEQPDLSTFQSIPSQTTSEGVVFREAPKPVSDLKELLQQLAETLQVTKAEGKTDTTITLKYPPLFQGVQVTLTSFETARGEFNLSFTNLTQQAKNLLDLNMNAFRLGMEQKGHILHMITTSPHIEKPPETQSEYFGQRGHREDKGKEGDSSGKGSQQHG